MSEFELTNVLFRLGEILSNKSSDLPCLIGQHLYWAGPADLGLPQGFKRGRCCAAQL